MSSKPYVNSASALLVAAAFLSLLVAGGAAAQTMPRTVSGVYTNEDAGVTITFPDGWEGSEISTPKALMVMTAEGGFSGAAQSKMIALMISEKSQVTDPTDTSQLNQDPNTTCQTPVITSTTVSGMSARGMIVECTQADGGSIKYKMVIAESESKWISIFYTAPAAEFDADVGKFDATVQSVSLEGGAGGGGIIQLTAVTRTVVIADANVDVSIRTNSSIGQLELDEENNSVSFTVEGQTGTTGTTEISIGRMLEGPYTVTIDGQATTNFQVDNEGSTEALMTISYTHSEHDVVVTGTSVVPEFPVAVIGVIAAIIGIVAIIGRTNFVTGYRQA